MNGLPIASRVAWASVAGAFLCACTQSGPTSADLMPSADLLSIPDLSTAPDGGTFINQVGGMVVDEQGAPLNQLLLSVCAGQCYFGKSQADGHFTIPIGAQIPVDQFALEVHGNGTLANYYTPLPAPLGADIQFSKPLIAIALPATGPAVALDNSAQTLTGGGVTLTLDAGTEVHVAPEDIPPMFRPQRVSDPRKLPFVDVNDPPRGLYVFSPFDVVFSKPAHLSLQNQLGLAAGSAVTFQQVK